MQVNAWSKPCNGCSPTVLQKIEPYESKGSSPVLRRLGRGNQSLGYSRCDIKQMIRPKYFVNLKRI